MSPTLFSLFISELAEEILNNSSHGVQLLPERIELLHLLFADDVALFSDTVKGLQNQLNILENYSKSWDLTVNMSKTEIVVFKHNVKNYLNKRILRILDRSPEKCFL